MAVARDEQEPPTLILDAGTGIRRVSTLLGGEAFRGAILLGHLHWDHTQGLPFFSGGDDPAARVEVRMPAQGEAEAVLARAMSPPHFPIRPSELRGDWRFAGLEAGEHEIEGFAILALDIPHKGGRTFGYRVSDGTGTIAYLSDHCPTKPGPGPDGLGEYHEAARLLTADCDLVFHDAQYTDDELPSRAAFGHASCGYAVRLAEVSRAKWLLLYHHDPARTDEAIDGLVARYQDRSVRVGGAAEGMVIDVPTGSGAD